eukprot:187169-Pyramimonas_sp.AAC.1
MEGGWSNNGTPSITTKPMAHPSLKGPPPIVKTKAFIDWGGGMGRKKFIAASVIGDACWV